jgi:hypothetical protein
MMTLVDVYAVSDAAVFLYELLQAREQEHDVNISHSTCPTWEQHCDFVISKPYRLWYLIEVDGVRLGYISATDRNEIGIVLLVQARGIGIGTAAVRYLMREHRPLPAVPSVRSGHWLANINPNNTRSIAMFHNLGFRMIQNTYAREP